LDDVFATRLKELRLCRHLTLKNVGDAVNCSMKTISNLENNRKLPSLILAMSLAHFFEVSLDYFFGRSDIKTNAFYYSKIQENYITYKKTTSKSENTPRVALEMTTGIFAARIKALRLARRLTQQNVSDEVGWHMKTISNLEKKHSVPSLGVVLAFADFFTVSVDYLVGWTDYNPDMVDHDESTSNPGSSPGEGRKELIELVKNLHGDNIDKALSYIAFLRYDQQRKDKT